MKFKLVENLRIIDYSNKKLTESLDINMLSDEDLKTLESSSDNGKIYNNITLKILADPNNAKYKDYTYSLQDSILKYRSLDATENPFIAMLNAGDQGDILELSDDEFKKVLDLIESEKLPIKFIENNFSRNGIADLLKKDPKWTIRIFKLLSNANHDYKNAQGKKAIIQDFLDGDNFKSLDEMKKIADTFSKEDRADLISVKDWFKDVARIDKDIDIYNKSLDIIKDSDLSEDDKSDLTTFIKNLFSTDEDWKKTRSYILAYTQVNQYTKPTEILNVLQSMYSYYKDRYGVESSVDITLRNYLENELNLYNLNDQLEKIKEIILNDPSISDRDKSNIDIIIKKLGNKQNSKLLSSLLKINIPDESKIGIYINKEIQKLVDADYLETTIGDALTVIGIQPQEGLKYLHSQVSDNPEYANLLNSLWKDLQTRQLILNKPITKNGKNFSWKEAIIDFLENVKDRGADLSLNALLLENNKIDANDQIDQIISWIKNENKLSKSSLNSVTYRLHQLLDKEQNATFKKLLKLQILDKENITKDITNFISENIVYFGKTTIQDALRSIGYNTPEVDGQRFLQSSVFKKQIGERNKFLSKFKLIWTNPQEKRALLNTQIEFKDGKFNWLKAITNFMNSHDIE